MRAWVWLAAALAVPLAGCTTDWAAADRECEKMVGRSDAPGEPAHVDLRDLGGKLSGSGPAEVHCHDLRIGAGGSWLLRGVVGNVGSIRVPAGNLTIEDSVLVVDLDSHPFGRDPPRASLTIRNSTLIVDGFSVHIDHRTDLRMEEVTIQPDDFFRHYSFGPFGADCGPDAWWRHEGRSGTWSLSGVDLHGVSHASILLSVPPQRTTIQAKGSVCAGFGPAGTDLSGLEVEAQEVWLLRPAPEEAGEADTALHDLVAPRGAYGRLGLVTFAWPAAVRLRADAAPALEVRGDAWVEAADGLGLPALRPACSHGCPPGEVQRQGIAFTAAASPSCPQGGIAGVGHWASLAFPRFQGTGAGAEEFDLDMQAVVDGQARPHFRGTVRVQGDLELQVPVLERLCEDGDLVQVGSYEVRATNGVWLGCARLQPHDREVRFRTVPWVPEASWDATCRLAEDLPLP